MRHFRRLFAKFGNLFRSGRADRELDREVSAHLALLVGLNAVGSAAGNLSSTARLPFVAGVDQDRHGCH